MLAKALQFCALLFIFNSSLVFAVSPYDDDLRAMSGDLRAMIMQAEKIKNSQEANNLANNLFELSKRLHRLEEEAGSANNYLAQQGKPSDKGLEFAQNISKSLDLSQRLLTSYMYTMDQKFLNLSKKQATFSREMLASQ
ncbi:hypothetical protein KXR87_08305 [Yokenella regensburgei]|uniref:hypothetical protein n=1 Tax=Yokenella regensburgei TaxID=158877 RepID=UPI003F154BAC